MEILFSTVLYYRNKESATSYQLVRGIWTQHNNETLFCHVICGRRSRIDSSDRAESSGNIANLSSIRRAVWDIKSGG